MANLKPTLTCHSRYCQRDFPYFWNTSTGLLIPEHCQDVTGVFAEYFTNLSYYDANLACCKLFCGERSFQILQLQCQNASEIMVILTWAVVCVLVLLSVGQLLSVSWERGWRKVIFFGGPLFLAFIALVVYLVTDRLYFTFVDTPFYPIVGAMNVAAFSYYFSSFQYSIGLAYEFTSGIAIVVTMFPVWTLLTVKMSILTQSDLPPHEIEKTIILVLVMLLLAVIWIVHSILYRTVGYRADWIAAYNDQMVNGHSLHQNTKLSKNYMSRLWMLAGAQGHPTWRTPAGQSIGLCLTVLSWITSASVHKLLQKDCKEDLILFHILLWVPPSILSLAILMTFYVMINKFQYHYQGSNTSISALFFAEYKYLRKSYQHMEEAVISYRLGRDTLEVEDSDKLKRYRSIFFRERKIEWVNDKVLVVWVLLFEVFPQVIGCPWILVVGFLKLLGKCVLICTATKKQFEEWSEKRAKTKDNLNVKIKAFQTLCENCLSEGALRHAEGQALLENGTSSQGTKTVYERSWEKDHGLDDEAIDNEVAFILENCCRMIRLPLLLDNIGPSGLSYLLKNLPIVKNPPPAPTNFVLEPEGSGESLASETEVSEDLAQNGTSTVRNGTLNQDQANSMELQ